MPPILITHRMPHSRRPSLFRIAVAIAILIAAGFFLMRAFRHGTDSEADGEGGSRARTTSVRKGPEEIGLYFSHTYENNPGKAQIDRDNIDLHMIAFIGKARATLDGALFELESRGIADALVAARDRGVRIRLVADGDYRENPDMARIVEAGIDVVFDERSALMHNKFLIADGERIWTGSFNATDNCSYRNNNNAIEVPSRELAENYTTEFDEMFSHRSFGPRSTSQAPHSPVRVGEAEFYSYFSPEDDVPTKITRIIRLARRSVRFMAFSFSDRDIAAAMLARAKEGVQVEGVVETTGSKGARSVTDDLMREGIDILRDGNRYLMHHKVIVVDGLWTITGSYNFSASAARSNDENILIVKSAGVAKVYEEEYQRIRAMAEAAR